MTKLFIHKLFLLKKYNKLNNLKFKKKKNF